MKYFAGIEQLRNVPTNLSPPPQPFSYIRIADIPEPYRTEFQRFVWHQTRPYMPEIGEVAYYRDYQAWLRSING